MRRRTVMAAKIEKYCAPGVYDPPGYSQAIKVTGAQTIQFLAGQVPYEMDGTVKHRRDFRGQARALFGAVKALVEAGGLHDRGRGAGGRLDCGAAPTARRRARRRTERSSRRCRLVRGSWRAWPA